VKEEKEVPKVVLAIEYKKTSEEEEEEAPKPPTPPPEPVKEEAPASQETDLLVIFHFCLWLCCHVLNNISMS